MIYNKKVDKESHVSMQEIKYHFPVPPVEES